jgi:hypothetical protein
MQTREQILNDPGLNPYQQGQLLEQLSAQEHGAAVARPPLTPDERGTLERLAAAIKQHADQIADLERREKAALAQLEQQRALLPSLHSSTAHDDDAGIDKLVREQARLLLLTNFSQNVPSARAQMLDELTRTMRRLDEVLLGITPRQELVALPSFSHLQNSPLPRCQEALQFIASKLK